MATKPSESRREISYVLVLFMVSFILHRLVWFLPFVLVLPILLTFTIGQPLFYLGFLVLAGELYSVLPPGIITIVMLTPWVVHRLTRAVKVDISFTYLALLAVTVALQLMGLFIYDSWLIMKEYSFALAAFKEVFIMLPWPRVIIVLLAVTSLAYGGSVLVYFNRKW